ncbi:hypothetical protein GpartN1_g623.t1 [Galdieria partita]|uniref:Uncharacterized protein n=1 Tax=Galdieria partita TaxID=83374 RepID=A0A9C7PSD7_9RHOD|nr:hypothetical protein GpartN1_g623.t1 [Galdieria partita]
MNSEWTYDDSFLLVASQSTSPKLLLLRALISVYLCCVSVWLFRNQKLPLITFTSQTFCLLSFSSIVLSLYSFYFVLVCRIHLLRFLLPVFHKLTTVVPSLFFIVAVHTLFLDGVWWFVLKPRTKEKVDFLNMNEHGPINLVIILTQLYFGNFVPTPYVLLFGFLYLVCYGFILYSTAASTGEFVYYFLDISKPKNLICLILMLLWYLGSYILIRYFVLTICVRYPSTMSLISRLDSQQGKYWNIESFQVYSGKTRPNNYLTFS